MTLPPDSLAAGAAAAPRRPRASFNRGYSRFVGLAKRILPVVAVILLLIIGTWPKLWPLVSPRPGPEIGLPKLDPREAKDLRMVNAHYTGVDRQNRPFVITAEVARQNSSVDQLIALEGPKGDLTTASGGWFELTAYSGTYQPDGQLLELFGNVQLFQDKGNEFATDSAHIDVAKGTAEGNEAVTGQGPFGQVTGEGFRILERGDIIIFTGHAHLVLVAHEKPEQK
jgi:lipopolysaccharide export system protein LptC